MLEILEREGIPIDLIAGTSAGALIGALYARSKDEIVKSLAPQQQQALKLSEG